MWGSIFLEQKENKDTDHEAKTGRKMVYKKYKKKRGRLLSHCLFNLCSESQDQRTIQRKTGRDSVCTNFFNPITSRSAGLTGNHVTLNTELEIPPVVEHTHSVLLQFQPSRIQPPFLKLSKTLQNLFACPLQSSPCSSEESASLEAE